MGGTQRESQGGVPVPRSGSGTPSSPWPPCSECEPWPLKSPPRTQGGKSSPAAGSLALVPPPPPGAVHLLPGPAPRSRQPPRNKMTVLRPLPAFIYFYASFPPKAFASPRFSLLFLAYADSPGARGWWGFSSDGLAPAAPTWWPEPASRGGDHPMLSPCRHDPKKRPI